MRIEIPGREPLEIDQLVLDMNGTIAVDGNVPDVVSVRICELTETLKVTLLTADTFGRARTIAASLGVETVILRPGGEAAQKADFVRERGAERCAAIGNGANDILMLEAAALSVAVLGREGMCADLVRAADVIVTDPTDALDLLLHPKRLLATLRG